MQVDGTEECVTWAMQHEDGRATYRLASIERKLNEQNQRRKTMVNVKKKERRPFRYDEVVETQES